MIIPKYLQEGTVILQYSDLGVQLRKVEDGSIWPDAVDVVPCLYHYEETDIPIPDDDIDADEALSIIGGET